MLQLKKIVGLLIILLLCFCVIAGIYLAFHWNLLSEKVYTASDFGVQTITSTMDYNQNGQDDYTDIVAGARLDAEQKPNYDGSYWADGYPPDDIGVCTDVVWRAFRHAGYCLRDMVDRDIEQNVDLYPRTGGNPDSNIDFRRVPNLKVFFERYATSLTLDPQEIEAWQPGDIVTYGETHIAIVSDRRNKDGIPYIIHNGGQPMREEDALTKMEISGHFRFDASKIAVEALAPFQDQDAVLS